MAQDFYSTLGVGRNASQKDIRSAYRHLARKYHPDVNSGDPEAGERFKRINEAYQVLSDEKTRGDYDEFGDNWRHAEQARNFGARGGFGRRPGVRFQQSDLGDLGGFADYGFGDLFGFGSRATGQRRGATRSRPQETDVQITLAEAYSGATRLVSYEAASPCTSCGGTGRRGSAICAACRGAGAEVRPVRLEVKIPPGIDDGGRIRLRPAPDVELTLRARVRPDSRFRREGSDLHVEVPAPYLDVILGGEVEVPTMTGRVMLTVPPGSQNGRSFRLSGKGMPRLGGGAPGALVATLRVVLPQSVDGDEKELFEQLRRMQDGRGGKGG